MQNPVILFDGLCNLCNSSVQFVIKRDSKGIFKFAALQSDFAATHLNAFNISPTALDSIILIEDHKVYQRSTAALRVARRLNGLWPLVYGFIVIPAFIRNAVYDYIARNRYRWFGKQESCWVPTPELKSRFLA